MDVQRYDVQMYGSPPWGFRLAGGADFNQEVTINRVTPGSVAYQHGIRDGDTLLAIDGHSTGGMAHLDVQNMVKQIGASGQLRLSLQKKSAASPNAWARADLFSNNQPPYADSSVQYRSNATATPTAQNKVQARSFSSHVSDRTGSGPTTIMAGNPQVQHLQYNSPMGLYSTNNVYESLRQQTQGLAADGHQVTLGNQISNALYQPKNSDSAPLRDFTQSSAYRALQEESRDKESEQINYTNVKTFSSSSNFQPRGTVTSNPSASDFVQSRSFRRLQRETDTADQSHPSASRFMGDSFAPTAGPSGVDGYYGTGYAQNKQHMSFSSNSANNAPLDRANERNNIHRGQSPVKNNSNVVNKDKPYSDIHGNLLRQGSSSGSPALKSGAGSVGSFPDRGEGGTMMGYNFIQPNQFNTPTDPSSVGSDADSSGLLSRWQPPSSESSRNQLGKKPNVGGFNAARQNLQSAIPGMPKSLGGQPLNINTSDDKHPSALSGPLSPPGGDAANRTPTCQACKEIIRGPFVTAVGKNWHPQCFKCTICATNLQDQGFVQDDATGQLLCEECYNSQFAPVCHRCNERIVGDVLHAIEKTWHAECFVCSNCKKPFGTAGFHLEDGEPYCEDCWNELFTSKCDGCQKPIQAGHRWLEALNVNWHAECFKCATCLKRLEGETFFSKSGRPYCREHNR